MELVFATHNPHKVRELRELLPEAYTLLSLANLHYDDAIAETAPTLEGNASIKAQTVYDATGLSCIADDTGLYVAALEGAPGVHSARYAGHAADAEANRNKLLQALGKTTHRKAYFKTVIAYIHKGTIRYFEGRVQGTITSHPRGTGGFGYDPIFVPDGFDRTFGEMNPEQKNAISHRALAIQAFLEFLNAPDIA